MCGVGAVVGDIRLIVIVTDEGAGLFCYAICRAHQVGGEGYRRDAGISDTNVGKTVDAEVRIHDAALVERKHGA